MDVKTSKGKHSRCVNQENLTYIRWNRIKNGTKQQRNWPIEENKKKEDTEWSKASRKHKQQACQWMACDRTHMCPHTPVIYLGMLSLLVLNFIWRVNPTPMCSVILLQIIHLQLRLSWVSVCRSPLYYIVFRSKHISVSEA